MSSQAASFGPSMSGSQPGVPVPGARVQGAQIPGTVIAEQPHRPAQTAPPQAPAAQTAPPQAPAAQTAPPQAPAAQTAPPQAPAAEPAERSKRGSGMASGGRPVEIPGTVPNRPTWPGPRSDDEVYVPDETFDASDLAEVNRQLNRARARMFRCSQQLKAAQRALADADLAYSRAMRRQLVTLSGGTEASRRAMAEIFCEPLENDLVIARQVAEEWKKRCTDARDDLKAVENISHNVRAQMDIR